MFYMIVMIVTQIYLEAKDEIDPGGISKRFTGNKN
jgi:hypothetical protein